MPSFLCLSLCCPLCPLNFLRFSAFCCGALCAHWASCPLMPVAVRPFVPVSLPALCAFHCFVLCAHWPSCPLCLSVFCPSCPGCLPFMIYTCPCPCAPLLSFCASTSLPSDVTPPCQPPRAGMGVGVCGDFSALRKTLRSCSGFLHTHIHTHTSWCIYDRSCNPSIAQPGQSWCSDLIPIVKSSCNRSTP